MKLTPLDIRKQQFKKGMRGFDSEEVEAFLEMVAEEYETLVKERSDLQDKVIKLETSLKNYQQVEKSIQATLIQTQESSNQARANAEKEAKLILQEAKLQSQKILEETKLEEQRLQDEMVTLKSQRESFTKRLKYILSSQIELIKILELDDEDLESINPIQRRHLKNSDPDTKERSMKTGGVDFLKET